MLRPLGWRDLPTLYQYRHQGVFLHSAQVVTRGASLFPVSLLQHLKPSTFTCTWICNNHTSGEEIVGQSIHIRDAPFAQISFLAPQSALRTPSAQYLIDQLARLAGQHDSFFLLAEVEARSEIFEVLRKSGFSAYAQQHIWQISKKLPNNTAAAPWKTARPVDRLGIQALYRHVTPEKIQHIEAYNTTLYQGLVYIQGSEVLGFAHLQYGSQGIWVHPYLQRNIVNAKNIISGLLNSIPERRSRPLYICVRAYQANFEPVLQSLGAAPRPQQTNMVKHLAAKTKVRNVLALPKINGQPEISMPFITPGHKLQVSPPKIELNHDLK